MNLFFIILFSALVACGADGLRDNHKFGPDTVEGENRKQGDLLKGLDESNTADESSQDKENDEESGDVTIADESNQDNENDGESGDATITSDENSTADDPSQEAEDDGICIIIKFNKAGKSVEEIAEYLKENYKGKTSEEIADMLHECKTPADLMIVLLIKFGMNAKDAVDNVMELTDCSIQLVIKVLTERLLIPTAEIIKILFELKMYTIEQIIGILQAAIEAGLLIKNVVVEEVIFYLHGVGEPLLKVVECALGIAGDSIQLIIRILHDTLAVPTAQIIKILLDLGKFTINQVAEILRVAVNSGILIKEVVVEELLVLLHAIGEPLLKAIECALHISADSIQQVIKILHERLLVPTAEIIRILFDLGIFSTEQVAEILKAAVQAGVLISQVVITELLTVLNAIGEPLDNIIKCALMISENSIKLIIIVLKENLLKPGVEIAMALIQLGKFTTAQIVNLLYGVVGLNVEAIVEILKATGMAADNIRDVIIAELGNHIGNIANLVDGVLDRLFPLGG